MEAPRRYSCHLAERSSPEKGAMSPEKPTLIAGGCAGLVQGFEQGTNSVFSKCVLKVTKTVFHSRSSHTSITLLIMSSSLALLLFRC